MKSWRLFLLYCLLSLFAVSLCTGQEADDLPVVTIAEETETTDESFFAELEEPDDFFTENVDVIDDEDVSEEYIDSDVDTTLSIDKQYIEMEIRTSSIPELAAWCRSLGLSESGTRADLSRQLRGYYSLPEPRSPGSNQKVITVESAQTSEYFKIEVTDEEYARLSGDVRLTLIESGAIHKIQADEILFNRTRSILTAAGNVEYRKEEGDKIETFRGDNITVNIDNWASIFLDGDSELMTDSDGTAYLFSGLVISRTSEDVTILTKARISNAKNPEALWSINASKLWLLPGSDFAFFNGVLKVGEIPVFYLPFFFYPVDEMIFHPVIGYRSREGGFVQTTTYILGRPKAESSSESSITRILGDTSNTEQERHGLFLRSTGKKITDPDKLSLKALIDYYVNLGAYFGLDLAVPKTGILNPLDLSIGVGVTRTVTLTGFGYTPYAPDYDGTFDWNHSNLFSQPVPFRYRMDFNSSITTQYANLLWSFPYYSDPYVDMDFLNRSESMDWFGMIRQDDLVDTKDDEISSYQWDVRGNINPPVTALNPYVSRINITNLSTALTFKTIQDNEIFFSNKDAPGRYFYSPDKYTIYSLSGTISGTPLTIGRSNQNTSAAVTQQNDDPFSGIGIPVSPWTDDDTAQDKTSSDELLTIPVLNMRFDVPQIGNYIFNLDYNLSPTGTTELQFMNANWISYDQVDWNEVRSILSSLGGSGNLNFRLNHSRGLFANVVTFSGSTTWRDYNYLNEEADIFLDNLGEPIPERIEAARRQQYAQTNYSSSYENTSTYRPFYQNDIFGQSNLQYNLRGTIVRSKRYIDGDGPELTPQWGTWEKEHTTSEGERILGVNSHRLSSNMAANVMDKTQELRLSVDLPPLDGLLSSNATLRIWITESRLDFRMKKPEESEIWIYDPYTFTEIIKFNNVNSFTYYMVVDPEENHEITNITSTLTLWGFRASYKALKTTSYRFVSVDPSNPSFGGGWEQYGEPSLAPSELSLGYRRILTNVEVVRNRMRFSTDIDTSINYDLLRYTNSNLQFQMGFNVEFRNFLGLRLSATSENNVIFRYFKNVPGMVDLTSMYMSGPQNNVLIDLFDSFNFLDESKRRRSGFKLKRFNLAAIHYLGDWTAELGISMYPYMNTTPSIPKYEVTADVSFLVQWKPITEIKTDIRYEGEFDRWTRR